MNPGKGRPSEVDALVWGATESAGSFEEWRPVSNLPGYEVSDLGRDRQVADSYYKEVISEGVCHESR